MRVWKKKSRAQVALETAFVFTSLLLLVFFFVNLGITLHTKTMATYAAFMAARSLQVMGDQTGADFFEETDGKGGKGKLLSDNEGLAVVRTAEDIFTCSLPWMKVPGNDADEALALGADEKNNPTARCQEGKRKYKTTNTKLRFLAFKESQSSDAQLENVDAAFHEKGREPLRYGILNLKYRSPLLLNPMGLFSDMGDAERKSSPEIYVPVLVNPGVAATLKKQDPNEKADFKDEDNKP